MDSTQNTQLSSADCFCVCWLCCTRQGYETFIAVFYVLAAVVLVSLVLTVWVAVILRKDDSGNVWLRR